MKKQAPKPPFATLVALFLALPSLAMAQSLTDSFRQSIQDTLNALNALSSPSTPRTETPAPSASVIDRGLVTRARWEDSLSIRLGDALTRYRQMERANKFTITSADDPILHLFDQRAADYIREELTTDSNLRNERGIDTSFYFFWSRGGNMQVHIERTLTDNRTWSGGGKTWKTEYGFVDSQSQGHTGYGSDAVYYILPGQKYDTDLRITFLQNMQDSEFASIARDVHAVASVTDYDFASAYGLKVKYRNNGHSLGVCDGYADTLFLLLQQNPNVRAIRKVAGGNHAWIECDTMISGKTIYCDATWYDSNSLDEQGYVVAVPEESLQFITYDEHTFQYMGTSPGNGKPVLQHIGTVTKTWTRN
jgi:hypothetical protein